MTELTVVTRNGNVLAVISIDSPLGGGFCFCQDISFHRHFIDAANLRFLRDEHQVRLKHTSAFRQRV